MVDYARADEVSVTLTAQEWDALLHEPYAYDQLSRVRARVVDVVGPPDDRRASARQEAQARLPVLTAEVKRRLDRHVGELIDLREDGKPTGDHLGIGDGWPKGLGGWNVTCIATTHMGGPPNMHFCRTAVWFEHNPLKMTDSEVDALVAMVRKRRTVVDIWGGAEWLSVTWRPRA